ncbi:hypothetical protein Efla_000737 [Eimeria flavescens]
MDFFLKLLGILVSLRCIAAESSEPASQNSGQEVLPSRPPVRLILTDVDGTLTDASGSFVAANAEGMQLARRLGIEVGFATGRGPSSVKQLLTEEQQQQMEYVGSPGAFMNGCLVFDKDGRAVVDQPLSPQLAERLKRTYEALGITNLIEGKAATTIAAATAGAAAAAAGAPREGALLRGSSSSNSNEEELRVYNMFALAEREEIARVRPVVEAAFAGELTFSTCRPTSLCAHSAGCNKGAAVHALAEALQLLPEEVLVLGDGENDLPMFKAAGTAVAVGNASAAVKEAADFVTVKGGEGALLAVVKHIQQQGRAPLAAPAAAGSAAADP